MIFKVALIGCGNIGSRHLQGLKKTQRDIMITVCEPSEKARQIALERYNQIPENEHIKEFKMIDNYKKLQPEQHLVIVATNANGRYEIVRYVLEDMNIKYILLEKVVFQQLEHFDKMSKLIQEKNVKVWVNCTRRMFEFYDEMKKLLERENKIDMMVRGSSWGMGSNSIHLLDIYKYITNCKLYQFDNSGLLPQLFDSKRDGYKEFFGQYIIETDRGKVMLQCEQSGNVPLHITFSSANISVEIEEASKSAIFFDKIENHHEKKEIDVEFQSSLTNKIVEQIIDNGQCQLTIYEDSAVLHKIIVECYLDHMNKYLGKKETICPIT